jgi:hypothetical protein
MYVVPSPCEPDGWNTDARTALSTRTPFATSRLASRSRRHRRRLGAGGAANKVIAKREVGELRYLSRVTTKESLE